MTTVCDRCQGLHAVTFCIQTEPCVDPDVDQMETIRLCASCSRTLWEMSRTYIPFDYQKFMLNTLRGNPFGR